jgi:hypothetical protein
MSTRSVEPGRGERQAASGYGAQYRVAAFLIYRELRQDRVGYIRIADLDAGRVDDLQLGDLVSRLAWSDRFRPRSLHEFPPPAFSYEPVRSSLEELVSRLDSLAGGYVAVLGSPGSGKSTLETETLRNRNDRVVRYSNDRATGFEPATS